MSNRNCVQCGIGFLAKRPDHFFCSGKCVAAYYRDNPNPAYIHRELPHDKPHVCEWCGVPYSINDYAERGGKRAPKYCSPKCKQAAYRARGAGAQEQARRRYDSGFSGENGNQREGQRDNRRASGNGHHERQEQRQEKRQEHRRPSMGRTGMDAQKAWRILGVSPNAPIGAIREAYRREAKKYHPDINKAPDAEAKMKDINAAYEFLKARRGA